MPGYFSSLLKSSFFPQKLGAAVANPRGIRMFLGEYADFDIPLNSQVYVQTPGDHVFINASPFLNQNQFPRWVGQGNRINNGEGHVYIRMYGDNGLTTNLIPLRNYTRSDNVYGHHCYILLPNETLLHAFLHPGIHARYFHRSTGVYVLIPGEHNSTYSGVLEPMYNFRPLWLPHSSSIHRR